MSLPTTAERERLLADIHEGMPVYDLMNEKIGRVCYVQLANDLSDEAIIASSQHLENAPGEVRVRLLKSGFIRIDSGLLRKDYFVPLSEVDGLRHDGIRLHLPREKLTQF